MPNAHDYYDPHHEPHDSNDFPHLHNRGEGRPYLEYDYHANDHGPQLPAISTIGQGPRGEGLTVGNVVNEDGTVSFALYSDLTGELVWQSPNLDPGEIEFQPTDFRDLVPGSPAPLDILYKKGGVTKTTTAYLPCGDRGSLVYLLGTDRIARNSSDTYQTTVGDLVIYNHYSWPNDHKPIPRVNDIVFFSYRNETGVLDSDAAASIREYHGSSYTVDWDMVDEITDNTLGLVGFGFGTIETVGTHSNEEVTPDTPVVFTARVFIPCYSELNEQERFRNEEQRELSERSRKNAETARVNSEASRASAEASRKSAEITRVNAEANRKTAENNRVNNETRRSAAFSEMQEVVDSVNTRFDTVLANQNGGIRELLYESEGYSSGTLILAKDPYSFDCIQLILGSHVDEYNCQEKVAYVIPRVLSKYQNPFYDGVYEDQNGNVCVFKRRLRFKTGNPDQNIPHELATLGGYILKFADNGTWTRTTISESAPATWPLGIARVYGIKYAQDCSAELADIRVGYDGTVYESAGDAIRSQIQDLINAMSNQ